MSRIWKLPIIIPEWVTIVVRDAIVKVTWPKWELTQSIPYWVEVSIGEQVLVSVFSDEYKNLWWLMRTLIYNMTIWVTQWYEKKLQVLWVWYSAKVQSQTLTLNLWLSHPVVHIVPDALTVSVEKDPKGNDMVVLQGIDKQLVGEQAAKIKAYRKPEPYKGKWIRYFGEYIKIKPGKTAGK